MNTVHDLTRADQQLLQHTIWRHSPQSEAVLTEAWTTPRHAIPDDRVGRFPRASLFLHNSHNPRTHVPNAVCLPYQQRHLVFVRSHCFCAETSAHAAVILPWTHGKGCLSASINCVQGTVPKCLDQCIWKQAIRQCRNIRTCFRYTAIVAKQRQCRATGRTMSLFQLLLQLPVCGEQGNSRTVAQNHGLVWTTGSQGPAFLFFFFTFHTLECRPHTHNVQYCGWCYSRRCYSSYVVPRRTSRDT